METGGAIGDLKATTKPITLTRIEKFSASHRLHNERLGNEENKQLYGKCNNEHGHGHNYTLEVTVSGPIKEPSGMIVNAQLLSSIIKEKILDFVDHRMIDVELWTVPGSGWVKGSVSSVERLVEWCWYRLEPSLPSLAKIRLWETDKNYAEIEKR